MSDLDGETMRILGEIKQHAARDPAFRAAILDDPVGNLQKHGLTIDTTRPVRIEYHDRYGLFVAIVTGERVATTADTSSSSTLLDHPSDDCLHY